MKDDEFEGFTVERATHRTIGDRHFVILQGFFGMYQGAQKPKGIPSIMLQYEVRHVMVPLSQTVERMLTVRDGDFLKLKYKEHPGELAIKARSVYVISQVQV